MNNDAHLDLGFDAADCTNDELIAHLDNRLLEIMASVEETDFWQELQAGTNEGLIREFIRQAHLEIYLYQESVNEATFACIAQMPRTLDPDLMYKMCHQNLEEFTHGEMALRDYSLMGGDEAYAKARRKTPSAFAVSGVWWELVRERNPIAYLGSLFLFEALTPLVTQKVQGLLQGIELPPESLSFIEFHAVEDIEHTRIVKELIGELIGDSAEARASVLYGFEYFAHVYPMPGWQAAFARAKALAG